MAEIDLMNQIQKLIKVAEGFSNLDYFNCQAYYKEWHAKVGSLLPQKMRIRFNNLEFVDWVEGGDGNLTDPSFNNHAVKQAIALLKDMQIKIQSDLESEKLIIAKELVKAREQDLDFDLKLAVRICGDNDKYPYRSSFYLTKFFRNLGYPFDHDGTTRRIWVKDRLLELDSLELTHVIQEGLFNEEDFRIGTFGKQNATDENHKNYLNIALEDFRTLIKNEVTGRRKISLNVIFDTSPMLDYFFEEMYQTSDNELNDLIKQAKSHFRSEQGLQIAVEKLWDAFERLKTLLDPKKDVGAEKLISAMSKGQTSNILEDEFNTLTTIGNNCSIRHHETTKRQITNLLELNYLYFRMLALINYALESLREDGIISS